MIQLATQDFCDRFVDYRMDPGRRLYDQMVMAARCGVANIAEGSARHSTSVETEMRLLDVARASFDELQGDIFNFLLHRNGNVWAVGNSDREAIHDHRATGSPQDRSKRKWSPDLSQMRETHVQTNSEERPTAGPRILGLQRLSKLQRYPTARSAGHFGNIEVMEKLENRDKLEKPGRSLTLFREQLRSIIGRTERILIQVSPERDKEII